MSDLRIHEKQQDGYVNISQLLYDEYVEIMIHQEGIDEDVDVFYNIGREDAIRIVEFLREQFRL